MGQGPDDSILTSSRSNDKIKVQGALIINQPTVFISMVLLLLVYAILVVYVTGLLGRLLLGGGLHFQSDPQVSPMWSWAI